MSSSFLDLARTMVGRSLDLFGDTMLIYFITVNTSYLVLVILAASEFTHYVRRIPFAGGDETYASPLTQPVSIIVPAYNEEASIVAAVRAMLALRYPRYEVIVVDDGSSDHSFDRLADAFDLVETARVIPSEVPMVGAVRSVHAPRSGNSTLLVVCKENGGKTDALNTGINLARYPLVCMVDADSLLDPDALLVVAKPFADDPLRVVATGGVVGVVNGCAVRAGRVVDVRMPRGWLSRIQVAEYLRAFTLGRSGWSRVGGLLVISGAFGLFRRDLLVGIGGLDHGCIGEDAELVVRLHRYLRDQRRHYRIVFAAEPVSWSEVPSTFRVLGQQRRRWHRGITEIATKHAGMIGNPRYGRIGLIVLPYCLLFEVLAPLMELISTILVPLGLALGVVDPSFALELLLVAYGYGTVVTLTALLVEEFSFRRYSRWRDLGTILIASVLENFGYRQLNAWWRLRGMWAAVRKRRHEWGVMTRSGFGTEIDTN